MVEKEGDNLTTDIMISELMTNYSGPKGEWKWVSVLEYIIAFVQTHSSSFILGKKKEQREKFEFEEKEGKTFENGMKWILD